MNISRLIFFVALPMIGYWISDAIFDKYVLYPQISLWSILINDSPNHLFYYRPTIVLVIGISGYLYVKMSQQIENKRSVYKQLLENINDGVFIISCTALNNNDKYIEINEAACAMLGYTKEELLQLSPQDIIDPERSDDLSQLTEMVEKEGHAILQTVLLKKDGSKIPVEITACVSQFEGELSCLILARDISSEEAFQEFETRFRILAERFLKMQEEEKGRLSQDLHDALGQDLLFLKLQVSSLQSRLPEGLEHLRSECGQLLTHLDETAESVRRISHDLSPRLLEEMGLTLAIETLAKECHELYEIKSLSLYLDKIDDMLSASAQLNLYRILQESLTNIGKHAQATKLWVQVKCQDDQIIIRIKDNGRGYDSSPVSSGKKTLGLSTIKERTRMIGGRLTIQSSPGEGTEIILTIPLREPVFSGKGKWSHESLSNSIG